MVVFVQESLKVALAQAETRLEEDKEAVRSQRRESKVGEEARSGEGARSGKGAGARKGLGEGGGKKRPGKEYESSAK